jgi:regulator of sigma E protease
VLLTVGAAIVVLGVLVLVHEIGHFLAAKAVGIAVLRFSIGLGPRTPLSLKRGETEYCLSWVPFGGYVKMAGVEDEGAAGALEGGPAGVTVPAERTFDGKPLWARSFVILAGVAMNALFAFLVYTGLAAAYGVREDRTTTIFSVDKSSLPLGASELASLAEGDRLVRINGRPVSEWGEVQEAILSADGPRILIEAAGRVEPLRLDLAESQTRARIQAGQALTPRHPPVLGSVRRRGPAAAAGLLRGDRVVSANGVAVSSWEELVGIIERHPGRTVDLVLRRGGIERAISLTPAPRRVRIAGGTGTRQVGRIGVEIARSVRRISPLGSVGEGARRTGSSAGLVLFTLKGLMVGQFSPRDIGGPILVGQLSGEAWRLS